MVAAAAPPTEHRTGGVFVAEPAVAATARAARAVSLGLVAQVRSYPARTPTIPTATISSS